MASWFRLGPIPLLSPRQPWPGRFHLRPHLPYLIRRKRLDGAHRSDRHEGGGVDRAMRRLQPATAAAFLGGEQLKTHGSDRALINMQAPKL